ncbi:MAG TPA: histidine phosphatase family protein [Dehalococcoidia bacterium]|nr:histidine phosphatase family protein [Dehalococcoidia bacterium]
MTRLIVIRHGRTEWNRVERFRGRADIDLDGVGVKQAEATAERIAEWQISTIYSSPLRRALTTARILAQHLNLEVELLPGIIDIDYGSWQGLSPEEAVTKDRALYAKWLENPHTVKFPDGESLAEVRERAALAASNVMQHSGGTIALVSHKVVCQILILSFLDLDNSHFWQVVQDVSAVNIFEIRDGIPSALLLNDTCHLKELKAS